MTYSHNLASNQLQASLAPASADPHGYWYQCKLNNIHCNGQQIRFLQGSLLYFLNCLRPTIFVCFVVFLAGFALKQITVNEPI